VRNDTVREEEIVRNRAVQVAIGIDTEGCGTWLREAGDLGRGTRGRYTFRLSSPPHPPLTEEIDEHARTIQRGDPLTDPGGVHLSA